MSSKSERERLAEHDQHKPGQRGGKSAVDWKGWGPYVSDRAWGTVREDYSADGSAWDYFPHDHARSRAYRWSEDGIGGQCDRHQRLCLALALWNGNDPILKERLFGLTGSEGNHGEDVKEYYFYLDNLPTHSYQRMLYKYPQAEFPYARLVQENRQRTRFQPEFELLDTGVFDENRYFDVEIEYAKTDSDQDILMRVTAHNRGPEDAALCLLPHVWFRNTWSWNDRTLPAIPARSEFLHIEKDGKIEKQEVKHPGRPEVCLPPGVFQDDSRKCYSKPQLCRFNERTIAIRHSSFVADGMGEKRPATPGVFEGGQSFQVNSEDDLKDAASRLDQTPDLYLHCHPTAIDKGSVPPSFLFCENETNMQRLYGVNEHAPTYPKDGINDAVVNGMSDRVNPNHVGTKAAALYKFVVAKGTSVTIRLRLNTRESVSEADSISFDRLMSDAQKLAHDFYSDVHQIAKVSDVDKKLVQRQAYAGLLWSKQWFHYDVHRWLAGDRGQPRPPRSRKGQHGRNSGWTHMHCSDIISMPDKWEYPWFASWDLAFHCVAFAPVDVSFAKRQLILILRDWYMHPSGQIPAYEWAFSDVNPPVHAMGVMKVYEIDKRLNKSDVGDLDWLEACLHKLIINFTWWVNRKDESGNNVFGGGFLGLDNVGVFDRSQPLPGGGSLQQSDGTSWMAMYCLNLMSIAMELARCGRKAYADTASKFYEHFLYIAKSMSDANDGQGLWDETDGFFYDVMTLRGTKMPLKVRSMVGLIPLFAVEVFESKKKDGKVQPVFDPDTERRIHWFEEHRPDLAGLVSNWKDQDSELHQKLVSLLRGSRIKKVLAKMLDPDEFLSEYGIRSLSKYHEKNPFILHLDGVEHRVDYAPGESLSGLFGGNSNWRGPIWMPVNFLIVDSLRKFHQYFGGSFRVECPTRSGTLMDLSQVADFLAQRLVPPLPTTIAIPANQRAMIFSTSLVQPHQMNLFLRQSRPSDDHRKAQTWRPIYAESRVFQEVTLVMQHCLPL
jgi:hypothetical protein